jgi:hypothetical protein
LCRHVKGKAGTSAFTRLPLSKAAGGFRFNHVGVVGLGKASDVTAEHWKSLGATATAVGLYKFANLAHPQLESAWTQP